MNVPQKPHPKGDATSMNTNALRHQAEQLVVLEHVEPGDFRALGPDGVPALIELFETATGDVRDRIRRRALYGLGVIGTRPAVEFLVTTAENDAVEEWLRHAAVRSLEPDTEPAALAYLVAMLDSSDFNVRKSAVLALGRSDATAARQRLAAVRDDDPDERLRAQAGRALRGPDEPDTRPSRRIIAN